ncbi:hypothetical protein psal_cds_1058 [Pandoravirus salinus]|uniref:Uncharacterized protein n=1 Tax=Pandoravirus salinus TaxID=1349410 RepID=S4W3L8_9VIRU|nr:hypothetical protein psal_cds_1058 [Pandoravirus salinus]AGO85262.1 hypothetical protein psal_cds_1058 [Pandoravirus salinus]
MRTALVDLLITALVVVVCAVALQTLMSAGRYHADCTAAIDSWIAKGQCSNFGCYIPPRAQCALPTIILLVSSAVAWATYIALLPLLLPSLVYECIVFYFL